MTDLTVKDASAVHPPINGKFLVWGIPTVLALVSLVVGWWMVGGRHFDLDVPLIYSGDVLLILSWIKRAMENPWIFHSTLMGAPFGGSLYDYPIPDSGSILALKIFGIFSGSATRAYNIYFLAGFPINAIAAYFVLRRFSISQAFSFAGGFVFTILPFHFLRYPHLFYTWYFAAPIFTWFSYRIYVGDLTFADKRRHPAKRVFDVVTLAVLSCFGVYYSFFGVIALLTAGMVRYARTRTIASTYACLIATAIVSGGIAVNLVPNAIYRVEHGANQEAADRSPVETEIFGLKIAQLLLPRPEHRLRPFAKLNSKYSSTFPLVNENGTSSLGLIGSAGFIALFIFLIAPRQSNEGGRDRLNALAVLTFSLTLFCTVGGFSSLFSLLISPMMRAGNRVSVFLAFTSIAATLLLIEQRLFCGRFRNNLTRSATVTSVVICAFAVWDQTTSASTDYLNATQAEFHSDAQFVEKIERIVPPGSTIYQLPYAGFPETPPINALQPYDLARGYLHSSSLAWSYGAMKGRPGDFFFRALAREPLERQIEVARRAGFSGLYLDRRGYADNGTAEVSELTHFLGTPPAAISENGRLVFFDLRMKGKNIDTLPSSLSPEEIMERAGFVADARGVRYHASLSEGIDFTRQGLPTFMDEIKGLSVPESWGRWSDANMAPVVTLQFAQPLPTHFILHLRAQAFGPNIGHPVSVAIGQQVQSFVPAADIREFSMRFDGVNGAQRIEIRPPQPVSPSALGLSPDTRMLAIGLQRLWIEAVP
ncbi:DUF7024 domain-containing protein [Paraburkholderia mimosarum]|uniref:DUF7024 domain-containing protein n=1 Tax=Paraburkholderia mimosarum TaxID=312026 RepID=UPI000412E495|nr:hypothetical protein [Paraburkholderia mimosarum]